MRSVCLLAAVAVVKAAAAAAAAAAAVRWEGETHEVRSHPLRWAISKQSFVVQKTCRFYIRNLCTKLYTVAPRVASLVGILLFPAICNRSCNLGF